MYWRQLNTNRAVIIMTRACVSAAAGFGSTFDSSACTLPYGMSSAVELQSTSNADRDVLQFPFPICGRWSEPTLCFWQTCKTQFGICLQRPRQLNNPLDQQAHTKLLLQLAGDSPALCQAPASLITYCRDLNHLLVVWSHDPDR